jgi:hypothetical protein
MTDYLGVVLSPKALVGCLDSPAPRAVSKLGPVITWDVFDWVLYAATALFIADVVVCW